jgi:surfeit locus 1 family protein
MMRRFIFPVLLGLGGVAVLLSLGIWQVQRLAWKEAYLAGIEAKIAADPVALPDAPDPLRDLYLPVTVAGRFTGEDLSVLSGKKDLGAGVRVIAAFETDQGRRLLVDRGFVLMDARNAPRSVTAATVTGNLHWPQDADENTPPPDAASGLWFARDVPAMAAALTTEPVLIVAREPTGDGIEPMPLDTSTIPNDHAGYAFTWFALALIWAVMTAALVLRLRKD